LTPASIAPDVAAWAQECFAGVGTASAEGLAALISEVADAARCEFDEESARTWAGGFQFSEETVASDVALLASSAAALPNDGQPTFEDPPSPQDV
jgi:hypothetical protein